jgi:hypothetical protein
MFDQAQKKLNKETLLMDLSTIDPHEYETNKDYLLHFKNIHFNLSQSSPEKILEGFDLIKFKSKLKIFKKLVQDKFIKIINSLEEAEKYIVLADFIYKNLDIENSKKMKEIKKIIDEQFTDLKSIAKEKFLAFDKNLDYLVMYLIVSDIIEEIQKDFFNEKEKLFLLFKEILDSDQGFLNIFSFSNKDKIENTKEKSFFLEQELKKIKSNTEKELFKAEITEALLTKIIKDELNVLISTIILYNYSNLD